MLNVTRSTFKVLLAVLANAKPKILLTLLSEKIGEF